MLAKGDDERKEVLLVLNENGKGGPLKILWSGAWDGPGPSGSTPTPDDVHYRLRFQTIRSKCMLHVVREIGKVLSRAENHWN
ncbi:hypothetical protein OEA41_004117 [Lepraria neglecta]|uniref:Uncharacterized protein n=1 Tax=Lepraria neglecta TaxID=209136 RepID=A0AAE0DM35_9LECA|nr:hypothetical protein OEA41_004117 [Lepraria neglecta]